MALGTILDAAERCFVASGFARTTMQQVAQESGCAIGTLYLYFKSKEDMFHAVVERHALELFAQTREGLLRETDPVRRVHAGLQAFINHAAGLRGFYRVFFEAVPLRHRLLAKALSGPAREQHDAYMLLERQAIEEAQRQGRIRSDISAARLQQYMGDIGLNVVEDLVSTDDSRPEDYAPLAWGLIGSGMGIRQQENGL